MPNNIIIIGFGYIGISSALNIRERPSTEVTVLTTMDNGTMLKADGCQIVQGREWCQVETITDAHVRGWTVSSYLTQSAAVPSKTAATRQCQPIPQGPCPVRFDREC